MDGDGRYKDLNGDRDATVVDVQTLFANLDSETVQNNPELFDFDGDDDVDIVGIQALFNQTV